MLQLLNCHDADTTEERYMEVIRSKTAKLFEAAAANRRRHRGQEPPSGKAMRQLWHCISAPPFSSIDDVLDYSASPERDRQKHRR